MPEVLHRLLEKGLVDSRGELCHSLAVRLGTRAANGKETLQ
jgi:hypothetical protein